MGRSFAAEHMIRDGLGVDDGGGRDWERVEFFIWEGWGYQ